MLSTIPQELREYESLIESAALAVAPDRSSTLTAEESEPSFFGLASLPIQDSYMFLHRGVLAQFVSGEPFQVVNTQGGEPVLGGNQLLDEIKAQVDLEIVAQALKEEPDREVFAISWASSILSPLDGRLDRDPFSIVESYLGDLPALYRSKIEVLAETIPSIGRECRLSMCIPVAAHEEERYIERTLESFLSQIAQPKHYEIVLLANHPDVDSNGKVIRPDNTIPIIQAFQKRHPELPIHLMRATFSQESVTIGYIRSVVTDAVLWRHHMRGREAGDIILVRTDADIDGAHPAFASNYIRLFDKNPHVDAFQGDLDWSPHGCARNPLLFISLRLERLLWSAMSRDIPEARIGGANTAFRGSAYAAVGGYGRILRAAEDCDLDTLFARFRKGSERHVAIASAGAASKIYVSTRRALQAIERGYAAREQWSHDEFAFGHENPHIRGERPLASRSFEEILNSASFEREAEQIINRTLWMCRAIQSRGSYGASHYRRGGELELAISDSQLRRILGWHFRLDYERGHKGAVRITNAEGLKRMLVEYHQNAHHIWEQKTKQVRSVDLP